MNGLGTVGFLQFLSWSHVACNHVNGTAFLQHQSINIWDYSRENALHLHSDLIGRVRHQRHLTKMNNSRKQFPMMHKSLAVVIKLCLHACVQKSGCGHKTVLACIVCVVCSGGCGRGNGLLSLDDHF